MTHVYQVETHEVEIADALSRIAAKCGWNWGSELGHSYPWLLLFPGEGRLGWDTAACSAYQTVGIPHFMELLKKGPGPKVTFRIKDESEADGSRVPLSLEEVGDDEVRLNADLSSLMRLRSDGTFRRTRHLSSKLGLQLDSEGRIKEYEGED